MSVSVTERLSGSSTTVRYEAYVRETVRLRSDRFSANCYTAPSFNVAVAVQWLVPSAVIFTLRVLSPTLALIPLSCAARSNSDPQIPQTPSGGGAAEPAGVSENMLTRISEMRRTARGGRIGVEFLDTGQIPTAPETAGYEGNLECERGSPRLDYRISGMLWDRFPGSPNSMNCHRRVRRDWPLVSQTTTSVVADTHPDISNLLLTADRWV